MRKYSLLTIILWKLDDLSWRFHLWFQHRRVESQMRDIRREERKHSVTA